jgi:hypothetical protein
VLLLSPADQLRIHEALSAELGGPLWQESERSRQARLRRAALEAMAAAAAQLGLSAGTPPSIPEFKRAAGETDLPMTFSAVYEAFENRWDIAQRFYRGERVPETAAQRRGRRGGLGTHWGDREHPLTCLRLFLSQEPPPASTALHDYTRWAKETNDNLPTGRDRVLAAADGIRVSLATTWEGALAVARGEKTLEEARQEALTARLAAAGPLVGAQLAGWILGLTRGGAHTTRPDYPQPVVCLFGSNWLWLRSDIEAYGQGHRRFTHPRGALQGEYLDSREIAERLGITLNAVRKRVDLAQWERVPRPAGKAGKQLYWSRPEGERWFGER